MKPEEPPLITILLLIILIILFILQSWIIKTRWFEPEPLNYEIREESVVRQITAHFYLQDNVLASLAGYYGLEKDSLLWRIVKCESNFDPTAKNPKSTAKGLCQF